MSGKRRKALERAFKKLHQGHAAPRTQWQERGAREDDTRPEFNLRSIHRGLKKRPADFGIGVPEGGKLTAIKVATMQSIHLREDQTAEDMAEIERKAQPAEAPLKSDLETVHPVRAPEERP